MKRVLIFNGTTRKGGDTDALIEAFVSGVEGEVLEVSLLEGISPCLDCRYCHTHTGCAVHDGMDAVYSYLDACEVVVLASPIWFSSLSGPALSLCSRLQTYFAAKRFRREDMAFKPKRGVLLLAGAQTGTERAAVESASIVLSLVGVSRDALTVISSMDTDHRPAKDDDAALEQARLLARALTRNESAP